MFPSSSNSSSDFIYILFLVFSLFSVLPNICIADQDPLTEDELLSSLLGPDDSPHLSAEAGITILGTGAVDPATTLDCHRRLYSYRVSCCALCGRLAR